MSASLPFFVRLLNRLFALALHLYPAGARREYAAEMQAVFYLHAADAAQHSAWTLFTLACREARDLPLAISSAHFHAVGGRMHSSFPSTSDQTRWPAALLSLLPFIIAGPLHIVLMYQPIWTPNQVSQIFFNFLVFSSLSVAAGFVLGAAKKFPRWAYPYPIFLAFSLYTLGMYATYAYHLNFRLLNSFFLFIAAILGLLCLPGLRWFYRRIPQDWTLLSYGLYAIVLYILTTIDKDETPRLNLQVMLPSLLVLGAALAHLRIRSAYTRIAALLAGTLAGVFFWLLPVFQGMITGWMGIGMGLFLFLAYGMILSTIVVSPLLVIRLRNPRRTIDKTGQGE